MRAPPRDADADVAAVRDAGAAVRDADAAVRAVWRGHAPNCSSSGSVVGVALVSAVAAATVVNIWAARFLRWRRGVEEGPSGGGPGGPGSARLRREADGSGLLHLQPEDPDESGGIVVIAPGHLPEGPVPAEVGAAASAAVPGALRAPTEVHLAVTSACPVACSACYLDAGPGQSAPEPDAAALRADLDRLAAMGVFEVAFGGGEALLRHDLVELCQHARDVGLLPNLTTSGFGLTEALARQLAPLVGQVNVSIDGLGATYRAARGWSGADRGLATVRLLRQAGIRVGVNTVLSAPLLEEEGGLEVLGRALAAAGAGEWQWLRLKPVGRGRDTWDQLAPSPAALATLWPRALALDAELDLALRFDCALVPFIAAHGPPVERLERLGVRGCPGGHGLWARDAAGAWAPCSFAAGHPVDDPVTAWADDPTLRAWRDRAATPPEPCASCDYAAVCRGGCRVVAEHLVGDPMAADPQCPRVAIG